MVYDFCDDGILLRVRLQPNSSSCRIMGTFTDAKGQEFLKIAVVSVPEKGHANAELLSFLAKVFKLAKSQIQIIGGALDRYKKVHLSGEAMELVEVLKMKIKETEK